MRCRVLFWFWLAMPGAAWAQPCPSDTARQLPVPPLAALSREQVLRVFADRVYGRMPGPPTAVRVMSSRENGRALGGLAVRRQVALKVAHGGLLDTLHLLLYLPHGAGAAVPVVLGLNFYGNSSIHPDTGIELPHRFISYDKRMGLHQGYATDSGRGRHARRWPLEEALRRGYAVATLFYGELYPDYAGPGARARSVLRGIPFADSTAPGAIGAWAWGLSRAVDYLTGAPGIDAKRIMVMGHSRQGKAALWAGAQDTRIALVIGNCAGALGASLSSHLAGEGVADLVGKFSYWFCTALARYAPGKPPAPPLPVDQHQLLAACAPRALYIASASEDAWADPAGEYAALRLAAPAWGPKVQAALPLCPPPIGRPITDGPLSYHLRQGRHDVTVEDWTRFLDFADRLWR